MCDRTSVYGFYFVSGLEYLRANGRLLVALHETLPTKFFACHLPDRP